MAKNPCVYTLNDGRTLSYDEVRAFMLDNFDMVSEGKTERAAEEKPMSAARKKAEAARKKAEEIRKATGGALMSAPKLVAAALDLYATLLEKYDDITKALNEFRKSKEYTDLSDEDKKIVDQEIGDEETDKAEIDFKAAEGETELASRGKRISEDDKFREKLNGFNKTYKSINVEAATALVDAYYSQNVSGQENGGKKALEFAKSLLIQDLEDGIGQSEYVFSKSAFGVLLAQKVLSDAQLLGDIDLATEANNFLDLVGRSSGLKVALMQAKISLDALGSYATAEAANQEKVGNETVSSGRKKKDVVKDIKEESDKAKAEAADEVSENLDVTDIIDNSKEPPKPQSKKASGKKAELEKKRKAAIDRVKKAFANKGVAGPLMAITPERAERIEAIKELAKVEIESGLYTLKEVIAKLAKDLNGVLSKKQISDVLIGEWNELAKIAEEAKRTESIELLKDAIENKVSDKALKALAKALKMADPEFIKTMNKGKRMSDAQIVEEILKDPQKAQDLLYAALGALIDDVNSGNHLDSVGVSKPKNMSDEEWDAVRKKYVINKFKQFVDTLIPLADERSVSMADQKQKQEQEKLEQAWLKAKERRDKAKVNAEKKKADKEAEKLAEAELEAREKELAEAERLWNNYVNEKVKEVVSKFYKNPNSNQTFVEALIEAIPSLSAQQAIQIAEKVQTQINKKLDQRDNKKIKELINEMTDGREDSSVNEVMQKIFFNRGAISQFGFTNMLSKYLGYKGLPQHAIAQITQLAQQAARMPGGALRTQIMNQANTIAASYSNTAWQNLYEILSETLVRNLLSKVKTAFTGGFSVSFFAIPNAIKKTLINRPANTIRALKFTGKNLYNGRWGVRNAFMESMYRHNDPFAQATERADNIYSKDRAWQRARKATFSEIKKLWGVDKGRAASMIAGRALIEGTFQGKLPITNIIPDAMAFMNYIAYKFMQDMNLAYMAQDKTIMEGIKPSDPKFKDEFLKKLSMTPAQLKSIETAVDNEIAQAVSQGVPVPKGFRKDRIREMIAQNTDEMLFQRAMEQSVYDIGMNNPKSALGAFAYGNLRKLKFKPQVEGQLSFLGMSINLLSTTLGLFSRQAIVLGERAAQYAPIIGTAAYLYPKRFDYKDNKLVVLKDDKDEAYNMYKSDPKEAAYRISVSVAVLGLAAYILANWWDDEEIIDPATGEKVVDPETGKPLTRQRYLMGGKVDFFGSSPKIRREDRGIDPTNTMRVYSDDGTFRDVPFEAMGQMYAFVMGLGQLRDKQRYGVEKVVLDADKLKDPTTIKAELQQSAEIDWASLATASAANAANTDFQTVSKIVKVLQAREKADIPAGLFDVLVINPAKGTVNPAVVRSLQEQYYNMSDRYKTYIKLESDVQNLGTYLAKDVWFLDPWIENRKDYESVDIFGNKIAYPPIYNDFLGSFGSTTNYVMANHVEEHKDMYSLFMVDGKYIPYPARYIYRPSKFDMAGMDKSVKVEDNLQRMISDKTYENFGVIVKQNMDLIKSVTDYDQRRELLDNMFDFASYQAVLFAFPNSQRKPSDTEVEKTPQEKEAMNSFTISNLPK
jgi:hypothetical protein